MQEHKLILVFIILIFSQLNLLAQEELSKDSLLNMSLEELMNISVTVASKNDQKISETPASVYVFTRQDIEENGYQYLSDILRFIPNMEVHWSGGPQYVVNAELRGMSDFILLLDGIRIDPASSVLQHLGYVYPLNNVKKVEVMMGPSSALYGADVSAGIINIITFEPDENSETFMYDAEKYVHFYGKDTLILDSPCCDRFNYHFVREK